jgi:hypothetical protein
MLKILIEKVTEILINTLNGRIRKIHTALNLFLYFGIFPLSYQILFYQISSHSGYPIFIYWIMAFIKYNKGDKATARNRIGPYASRVHT